MKVTKYADRKNWVMYYDDPLSGKRIPRSTGKSTKRDAEREAAKWEAELQEGRYAPSSKATWEDFTWRYREQVLHGLAKKAESQVNTVFRTVERLANPKRLADMTTAKLSYIATELRSEGKSEVTIRSYIAHLRSALVWAREQGLIRHLPAFPKFKGRKSKSTKQMKGRPISGEEFERMLAKVPHVLAGDDLRAAKRAAGKKVINCDKVRATPEAIEGWRWYLRALWASGLRLRESLDLYWDRRDRICVDLSGKHPLLSIPGECQKNGNTQLYPVAPEFGQMLLAVLVDQRKGRVFRLLGQPNAKGECSPISDADWVSRIVTRLRSSTIVPSMALRTCLGGRLPPNRSHQKRRWPGQQTP